MKKSFVAAIAVGACLGVGADVVSSTNYVKTALVAHWDGIDNTLSNGVRSHDDNATVWCDLSGNANDVPLTASFLTVESNAIYSDVVKGLSAKADINASKTGIRPALPSPLKGMTQTGSGGAAFTIEVVMQRATTWHYMDDSGNLQNVFSTPRGTIGYRGNSASETNRFYCMLPETYWSNNKTMYRNHLWNWYPQADARQIHTVAAVLFPNNNSVFVDVVKGTGLVQDGYTGDMSTNYVFFSNLRTAIRVHAIRVYSRALSVDELKRNEMLDRMRFGGEPVPMEVKEIAVQTFDGSTPCTPDPVVVNAFTGEVLEKEVDYTVAYADNDRIGRATLTVTGIGDWAGRTASRDFAVDPGVYHYRDYIASSGTQIIDTEFFPTPNTRMEAEVMFTGSFNLNFSGSVFCGCTEGTTKDEFSVNFGGSANQDKQIYTWMDKIYDNGHGAPIKDITLVDPIGTKMNLDFDTSTGAFLIGRAARVVQKTTATRTRHTFHIFGNKNNEGRLRPFTSYGMRVYSWKIWESNVLVRDFVPCIRAFDGEAGLLDRVSGRFFRNVGSGAFTSGLDSDFDVPGYTRLSYLQANAKQWIDIDYMPNPQTHLLMDYSMQGHCDRSRYSERKNGGLFGCQEADGTISFTCNYGGNPGEENRIWTWFDKGYQKGGDVHHVPNDYNNEPNIVSHALRTRLELFAGSGALTNGTASSRLLQKKTTTHTQNSMVIFGTHAADGTYKAHTYFDMRIYGFKIWDGSVLKRDLVPCLRNEDRKPGMYDRVSGRFFVNGATGEDFTYEEPFLKPILPAAYQPLDYLVATGVQHVATGVAATPNTLVSVQACNYNLKAGRRLFSSRGTTAFGSLTSGQLGFEVYLGTGNKWSCTCADGPNDGHAFTSEKVPTAGWDTVVTLDAGRGTFAVDGESMTLPDLPRTQTSPGEIDLLSGGGDKDNAWGLLRHALIFQNNQLVRNLVPCVRLADDKTGLYDLVSESFLLSSGDADLFMGKGATRGTLNFTGVQIASRLSTYHHYLNLTNFTVSLWTKNPDLSPARSDYGALVSMGALADKIPGFCCFVCVDSNVKTISMQVRTAQNEMSRFAIPYERIRPGKWHHIVFTYDQENSEARFYLDGKVVDSTSGTALLNPSIASTKATSYLTFGNRSSDHALAPRGELAHVSIWDHALNEHDVQYVTAKALTGAESGLLGYWPLANGMEGLHDHVANGNAPHDIVFTGDAADAFFAVDPVVWVQPGSIFLIR